MVFLRSHEVLQLIELIYIQVWRTGLHFIPDVIIKMEAGKWVWAIRQTRVTLLTRRHFEVR